MFLKELFRTKKKTAPTLPPGLTKAEQKRVLEIIKNADRRNKVPQTAQDTIPFIQMFKDGTCKVTEEYFSKTIEYMDVNYQLAQDDEKDAIFKLFKGLLNFFDSALNFQFSYIDIRGDEEEEKKQINIPMRGDGFDSVRESSCAM